MNLFDTVQSACFSLSRSLHSLQLRIRRHAFFAVFLTVGFSAAAIGQPAFPGAQGFGVETPHGRDGVVVIVSNLNDSGPGSLRNALTMTEPRIIVFRVSGTIALLSRIQLTAEHSNFYLAGQTAPGDGIAIRLGAGTYGPLIQFNGTTDFVVQHIRFRHGFPNGADVDTADNIALRSNTKRAVFDHNSFTWGNDENLSLWGSNISDITFSHNLFAEGMVFCRVGSGGSDGQNVGPFASGGNPQYNQSWHHNVVMHMCFRNFKFDAGNGGVGTRGAQYINNVHYNSSLQDYSFGQNVYSGPTTITVDVINDYFKRGPDAGSNTVRPFTLAVESSGSYLPMSLYLVGSTWREQNGNPRPGNDENDNFNMVSLQTYIATPTWNVRTAPISPQPAYPVVSVSTAAQAYVDLVIGKNAGATKPVLDSVDIRLLNDPEDGGRWSSANVPPPNGSASYPVLSTYNVPTDSDGDGVPDSYETVLGTDPNTFESQAVADHDGDGYKNIEEWINSLSGAEPPVTSTRPNPPTVLSAN